MKKGGRTKKGAKPSIKKKLARKGPSKKKRPAKIKVTTKIKTEPPRKKIARPIVEQVDLSLHPLPSEAQLQVVREPQRPTSIVGSAYFDMLDMMRRILMAQDMLFLSRQVTYHIAASAELPKAWANFDQVQLACSQLVENLVRRAARKSCISIGIEEFSFRNGPGVQIKFEIFDPTLENTTREAFVNSQFTEAGAGQAKSPLANCKDVISRQRGQLWADLKKPLYPTYQIVLPASEDASRTPDANRLTFKYDITISNFSTVRKRFGIKKSSSLVERIEEYVRSLVRYPIDMVMAVMDKGIITTIYETQHGSAESVASRISQRLGKEEFRIGRSPIDLTFRYHLSPLIQVERKEDS